MDTHDQAPPTGPVEPAGNPPQTLSVELVSRIESSFRDVYLTLISIIQGVAFGFLAMSALSKPRPTVHQWLAYTVAFLVILIVWQEYMVGSTAFAWTPTLLDSAIPYGVGLVEFLLIAAGKEGTKAFLTSYAVLWGIANIAYVNFWFHARRGGELNRTSYPILGRHVRFGVITCTGNFAAALTLVVVYSLLGETYDLAFLSAAIVITLPMLFHSIPNWSWVLYRIHLAEREWARQRPRRQGRNGTNRTPP